MSAQRHFPLAPRAESLGSSLSAEKARVLCGEPKPNPNDSMECHTHPDLSSCRIVLQYLPPGTKATPRDIAACSDCHLVIAEPHIEWGVPGLVIYCSGCRGMLSQFECIVGSNWRHIEVKTVDDVLLPSAGETRQAGVTRFVIPYIVTEDDLLNLLGGSGRPVFRYADTVR